MSALFFPLIKNKTILSPDFLGQRFNNLQRTALLTSLIKYVRILSEFGQEQLVIVNYACGFNQLKTGKYFK